MASCLLVVVNQAISDLLPIVPLLLFEHPLLKTILPFNNIAQVIRKNIHFFQIRKQEQLLLLPEKGVNNMLLNQLYKVKSCD